MDGRTDGRTLAIALASLLTTQATDRLLYSATKTVGIKTMAHVTDRQHMVARLR